MQKLTSKEIRDQMTKVLSSTQLSNSNILSGFLYFIVNETLAGRSNDLKEYKIGTQALKREETFNPQIDSIVRIHAGRLRRALREYYYEEGVTDPITIQIPKGSYVPTFELRSIPVWLTSNQKNTPETKISTAKKHGDNQLATAHRPEGFNSSIHKSSIAVLPFKKIGCGDSLKHLSQSIGEYLSTELTLFEDLKVISYYSAKHIPRQMRDIRSIGATLGAEYLLTGLVHSFDNNLIRLYIHLNKVDTGHQLWAHTYEQKDINQHYKQFLEDAVENILAAVPGIDGVIARQKASATAPLSANSKIGALSYWYTQYRNKFDKPTMIKAKQYYQEVIKTDPDNALALGYLSEILSSELLLSESFDQNTLELGLSLAVNAIKINPYCQQGYLALGINKLRSNSIHECMHALQQGLEINPKSTDYKATMGAILIYAGEFEIGGKTLEKAVKLNTHLPWWQILSYSYFLYHRQLYRDALRWADRSFKSIVWVPLVKAASYGQLGQIENGMVILDEMKKQFVFEDLSVDGMKRIFSSDKILKEILDGLRKLPYIFFFVMPMAIF
ncbi:MAG TPA: hypothetical protein VEW65_10470 [Chryseolinea sp.]|nr:hypothetical protein [Chryseolinea sp.]